MDGGHVQNGDIFCIFPKFQSDIKKHDWIHIIL